MQRTGKKALFPKKISSRKIDKMHILQTEIGFLSAHYRTLLLAIGIEKLIRTAKANNEICRESATDALRDLGLDNYNI